MRSLNFGLFPSGGEKRQVLTACCPKYGGGLYLFGFEGVYRVPKRRWAGMRIAHGHNNAGVAKEGLN